MNQRKVNSLQKRLHKHAAQTCANHTGRDGCLITPHERCIFAFDVDRPAANVCPYFMQSVAPADPALNDELLSYFPDDYPLKPAKSSAADRADCAECKRQFVRRSNRQKYCDECKAKVKREQAKEWARKKAANI
ncbi:hypothetical protein HNR44_001551 [Geomicrobium halophilum]|uniref:Cysteine-rich VLP n=1 Tax=Geomicrobium halophilum TaxID=549000 RepID=A0A841PYT7_9BACL|nr:hypothetical protein [Geomicrobium halophilum]